MHSLLSAALQPRQPLEVQLRALDISAEVDPVLIENVALNEKHPLQENAATLLSNVGSAASVSFTSSR